MARGLPGKALRERSLRFGLRFRRRVLKLPIHLARNFRRPRRIVHANRIPADHALAPVLRLPELVEVIIAEKQRRRVEPEPGPAGSRSMRRSSSLGCGWLMLSMESTRSAPGQWLCMANCMGSSGHVSALHRLRFQVSPSA
jgi:hypothetical protein